MLNQVCDHHIFCYLIMCQPCTSKYQYPSNYIFGFSACFEKLYAKHLGNTSKLVIPQLDIVKTLYTIIMLVEQKNNL